MVTFFATPRAFQDHMAIIQRNAIRSWLALCPPCEVLLLGKDEGTADMARRLGIRHIPEVERNEFGTPLLNSLFGLAEEKAQNKLLCQINADIMLTDDFLPAVQRLSAKKAKFLATGQRWDVDIEAQWDFGVAEWSKRLREFVKTRGCLHPATGLDYFLFVKGSLGKIPPFAIGRRILDNWLIFHARSLGLPVVDLTQAVTAVHQNHGYAYHPLGEAGVMDGPEVRRNLELAGGSDHVFTLEDATHALTPAGVKFILTRERLRHHVNMLGIIYPRLSPVLKFAVRLRHMTRCARVF